MSLVEFLRSGFRAGVRHTFLRAILILLLVCGSSMASRDLFAQGSYTWNNVRIVAGGFVPGIVYHPNVQGLVYARTDIGGLYRSTNGGANWTPLLDWVNWSNWGYSGVLSVALDPQNGNTVYAAVDRSTPPQNRRQHARSR